MKGMTQTPKQPMVKATDGKNPEEQEVRLKMLFLLELRWQKSHGSIILTPIVQIRSSNGDLYYTVCCTLPCKR